MSKLSKNALNAVDLIISEYGEDVADELLMYKKEKEIINCDVVNKYHIMLIKNSDVIYDQCEFGAVAVNCKRPYGNSDVINDIRLITGLTNSSNTLENLHRGIVGVLRLWIERGMPDLHYLIGQRIQYEKC